MKTSLNISAVGNAVTGFLRRFHTILFFLVVSGGLFGAIVLLLSVITFTSTPTTQPSKSLNSTFDEETIRRLKAGSAAQADPGDRQSPFVE